MKVSAVYFSPTGGSKKHASAIASALSADGTYATVDLTRYENADIHRTFGADDFVVFGFPCYKGRIPQVAVHRLRNIQGSKTPCIIAVIYGNRDYDDSLLELRDLVLEKGFVVQAAAALVAQHTFGEIQVGRPNSADEQENREFVARLLASRQGNFANPATFVIKGERPYRGEGNGAGFIPLTSDDCIQCGKCADECPVQAIGEDNHSIDAEKCLSCFRCIRICPVEAKNMRTEAYIEFARDFTARLSARRENEYFL